MAMTGGAHTNLKLAQVSSGFLPHNYDAQMSARSALLMLCPAVQHSNRQQLHDRRWPCTCGLPDGAHPPSPKPQAWCPAGPRTNRLYAGQISSREAPANVMSAVTHI